jgi:two-component system, NarL family, nitrate/nitrite response regulator NarL
MAWGLERMLQSAQPRLEVVGAHERVAVWAALGDTNGVDVAVYDLDGEGGASGVVTLLNHGARYVVVLGSSCRLEVLDAAVRAGARGVVDKRQSPEALVAAVMKVYEGGLWLDQALTGRALDAFTLERGVRTQDPHDARIASLTRRERELIATMVQHATAPGKTLATHLGISEQTLRNHLSAIYSKLGVKRRAGLYAYALQNGLGNAPV